MSKALLSLMLAAGIAALAYSKLGKRVGYGNASNVWTLVAVSFVLTFLIVFVLLSTLVDLN